MQHDTKPPPQGTDRLAQVETGVRTMSYAFVQMVKLPLCPQCHAMRVMILKGVDL